MGLMVAEQDFKYHWRCEKEKITHLCFADDLIVFCRAKVGSVSLIGECLNRFKALSGLLPNPDKSNLFASGVSTYLKDQLLDVLGYKEGVLPVRYHGVPLISSKLRASDCKMLVDRIIATAKSWTCQALSYAGRLQLINTVLFSIQVYWSSVILLPKAVIKQVENSLRVFLWKGSDLGIGGAKVAWAKISMPKEEGGLGLRGLEIWNKATIGRSIWELKCPKDCSWSWRKILGLRDIGRDKIKSRIGNGRHTSLWYDNWHPLSPLEKFLGERIIRESRLSRQAKLAIQGGIYTQSKLLRFGLVQSMSCVLWGCSMEDLDHLFFTCPFSERVWHALHAKSLVYAIWRERNAKTHGEAPKHEFTIIRDIVFSISARVNLCKGLVPSNENRWLQRSWDEEPTVSYMDFILKPISAESTFTKGSY
ncbi:uncharacterized protein LOC111392993 [Olea europaea var. sylvestris]|uniref:uncharacterized protein LOC111392993 n=1 Tax=Olea europaea var. sylvestris TaxID=158386 RepID=UPI000C1D4EE6|nr:uncharacterized protein LOC111392993 [Olea europaea var. sylvestris]